jgi:hypothetical protein
MPDTNPPSTFGTSEWKFLQTLQDHDKLQQFRSENMCQFVPNTGERWRLRYWCTRRYYKNKCKLMLYALKTIKGQYHVYKRGEHNHPILLMSKRHL